MKGAGINDGDLLIIDKSITPKNGNVAVCYLDGEFTLKRIVTNENGLFLVPENDQYPTIKITEENQLTIWGIVSFVVKEM
jgi:DNA polymerase V